MKRHHRAGYTIDLHKQQRNRSSGTSTATRSIVNTKVNRISKLHQPEAGNSIGRVPSVHLTDPYDGAGSNLPIKKSRTISNATYRVVNLTKRNTLENSSELAELRIRAVPEEPVDLTHHPMAVGMLVASAVLLGTALILYATVFAIPLIFIAVLACLLLGALTFFIAKKHFTYSEGTTENERNAKDLLSVLLFGLYYFLTLLFLLVVAFFLFFVYGLRLP